jgi:hypothetical protein
MHKPVRTSEGVKVFRSTWKAVTSQLPVLALMEVFTTLGRWVLSLPICARQVVDTAAAAAAGLTE